MKNQEVTAYEFLKEQGYESILYEPKGNRTPDFLINNKIAVEVRRLNQHSKNSTTPQPLEDLYFRLIPKLQNLFNSYNNEPYTESAFVSISFGRPLKANNQLLNKVKSILDNHSKIMDKAIDYEVNKNLTLEIFPSTNRLENKFNIGVTIDKDSGGFVLSNILDSLNLIIEEKERKTTPYYKEYDTWWLILIDFIGYGVNKLELSQIKESISKSHFDRIYFISPINSKLGHYI